MNKFSTKEKEKILAGLESRSGSVKDYCESVGISDVTLYEWRNRLNGNKPSASTPLEFNIVQDKEARSWGMGARFGRFVELKEGLLEQLRNIRKNQAITFTAPKEIKELRSVHHACYAAIKKAGLPYRITYSKSKGLFVVLRTKESNGAAQ